MKANPRMRHKREAEKLSEKATLFGQLMMLAGQYCAETMDGKGEDNGEQS